ncbi:MAG: isoprenylcysteine carboxylmethyltransferase family protein [Candidatus Rokubacteria bacterium]|nr:isoprenylcysteine carboxylmethyltransferase family protein [Candidatus Rokubacteria bacterium]
MKRDIGLVWLKGHLYGVLYLAVIVGVIPFLLKGLDRYLPLALPGLLRDAGVVVFLAGLALDYWCLWLFITRGRGTAFPLDPPHALVVNGPYRYVRNPIVIGMFAMILGEALYFTSSVVLVYTVGGIVAYHFYLVYVEEPELKGRFGTPYEAYEMAVPRWIPRLRGP